MPYLMSHLQTLVRVAEVALDIIPKKLTHKRPVEILDKENKNLTVNVNGFGSNSVSTDFDPRKLKVKIESGVNFMIQKAKAIQQIQLLMQSSPDIAAFFGSEYGVPILFQNMEFNGLDKVKEDFPKFIAERKKQQQQAMQMQQQAMQNNPQMMRAKNEQIKLQLDTKQNQIENQLKASGLQLQAGEIENERLRTLAQVEESERNALVQMDKHQTEKTRAAAQLAMDVAKMHHGHQIERVGVKHDHMELQRKIADTILTHKHHEKTESKKEKKLEEER
jgi:hypothetical protein